MDAVLTTWPSPCSTAGHEGGDAVDHAPEVHAEDPAPVLLGDLPDGTAQADARVVVDEVDRTEAVEGPVPQTPAPTPSATSVTTAESFGPLGGQLAFGLLEGPLLDVAQDDLHALGCCAAPPRPGRCRSPRP